jgi:hypothetical protein
MSPEYIKLQTLVHDAHDQVCLCMFLRAHSLLLSVFSVCSSFLFLCSTYMWMCMCMCMRMHMYVFFGCMWHIKIIHR